MVMSRRIRFVDAFAGIGGFHLAAAGACESLGILPECVKAIEYDMSACQTYMKNFRINPLGDMNQAMENTAGFPDHELLLGGFPCQSFSKNGKYYNSGKTISKDDDRAQLCFRLFDVLKAKQPMMFVFENVKEIRGIKNSDGEVMKDVVCSHLEGCGYDVAFGILDSADFGLAQQRKRAYFVGARKDLCATAATHAALDCQKATRRCVRDILEPVGDEKFLLSSLWKNRKIGQETRTIESGIQWVMENKPRSKYPDALANAAAGKTEVTRLEALKVAYGCGDWDRPSKPTGAITPVAIIYGDTPSGLPRQMDKLYSELGISPTIATFSTPAFDVASGWRTLSPVECARLQGFPDWFKLPQRSSLAYKQVGNAVSVNVAMAVISRLLAGALKGF
jgi:DNA (cytosine-5)-methyltransferase 1